MHVCNQCVYHMTVKNKDEHSFTRPPHPDTRPRARDSVVELSYG